MSHNHDHTVEEVLRAYESHVSLLSQRLEFAHLNASLLKRAVGKFLPLVGDEVHIDAEDLSIEGSNGLLVKRVRFFRDVTGELDIEEITDGA